jgi:hypothetical protein
VRVDAVRMLMREGRCPHGALEAVRGDDPGPGRVPVRRRHELELREATQAQKASSPSAS